MSDEETTGPRLRIPRRKEVEGLQLSMQSIIGSYFLRIEDEHHVVWAGLVLAEPQAGVYLLDLEDSLSTKNAQRLQTLRMMCEPENGEFRFFDTREARNEAYADLEARKESWLQSRRES